MFSKTARPRILLTIVAAANPVSGSRRVTAAPPTFGAPSTVNVNSSLSVTSTLPVCCSTTLIWKGTVTRVAASVSRQMVSSTKPAAWEAGGANWRITGTTSPGAMSCMPAGATSDTHAVVGEVSTRKSEALAPPVLVTVNWYNVCCPGTAPACSTVALRTSAGAAPRIDTSSVTIAEAPPWALTSRVIVAASGVSEEATSETDKGVLPKAARSAFTAVSTWIFEGAPPTAAVNPVSGEPPKFRTSKNRVSSTPCTRSTDRSGGSAINPTRVKVSWTPAAATPGCRAPML